MSRTSAIFCVSLAATLLGPALPSGAAESAADGAEHDQLRARVARLLQHLDSERFEVRRQASVSLGGLVAKPELGLLLSAEFHRMLVQPEVSFEVRWHLNQWCRKLPAVTPEPAERASPEELERLVRQLEDDSYGVRLGATRRLEWLSGNPKLVYQVMTRLKRRLAAPDLEHASRQQLESTWQLARSAWLLSDPADWDLPPISSEQIDKWIDALVRPGGATGKDGSWSACRVAEEALLDLMARDDYVARVASALQSRLAGRLDEEAAGRVEKLLAWTRPAMVAEYWQGHRHWGEQHLLIGVPSMTERSKRPSHFDYIDDETAHCVSGSNLSPGDYPVGVAIPHPAREDALFHLVNLPTPLRRMAYAHHTKTGEAQRLAALSRRTLDRILAEGRPLIEPELIMLAQLDPQEVSCFAGKYFSLVNDGPLPPAGRHRLGGRPSRFGLICGQLVISGTKEAAPGLIEAIDRGCFLPPTPLAPYRLHWLAALSIAIRDPWPSADAWLAGLISRNDVLVEGRPEGPELGATAAGVLLRQGRKGPSGLTLQPAPEALMIKLGVDGYRFPSAEAREKMQQWWQREGREPQGP